MYLRNNAMILRDKTTRLLDRLFGERIIYVCAPAGYGKTVAVRQWVADKRAKIFISMDEYDNNPGLFCEHFCAALRDGQPRNAALAEIISHPDFQSAPDEYTIRAIGALLGRRTTIVVIDNLGAVTSEEVLGLLALLLRRMPDSFQIVMISRNEFPPGFEDIWMGGSLASVTANDLRFDCHEIMLLYEKRGAAIAREEAENIRRITDGWPLGVSELIFSGGSLSGESIDHLDKFIRKNMWNKLSDDTREFLISTSIVKELGPSLCSALSGSPNSERLLEDLAREGAFVSKAEDGAYHYIPMFRNFLKKMLKERGEEYLRSLMRRKGHWHLSRQEFLDALECFIQCSDIENVSKCIAQLIPHRKNFFYMERLLALKNAPELQAAAKEHPLCFIWLAWMAFAEGNAEETAMYMDEYYARHSDTLEENPDAYHYIHVLRLLDFRASLKQWEAVMAALPLSYPLKRTILSPSLNIPLLHRGIRDFSELVGDRTEDNFTRMYDMTGWLLGDEWAMRRQVMMAGMLYEQGQLERAYTRVLAANAEVKKHFDPEVKCYPLAIQIYILDALDRADEADQIAESLLIITRDADYLAPNIGALLTKRRLARGDLAAAREWLAARETPQGDNLQLFEMYVALTTCRAYITGGDYDAAIILLTKALELAMAFRRTIDTIETRILLSIAYWKKKRGFQGEAIQHLESAVVLAYGFSYTQLFVNDGAELVNMMRRLQRRVEQRSDETPVPVSFIKMLCLKMLGSHNKGLTSGQPVKPTKYTDKQKTVMRLLVAGKSNKEIAAAMGIKVTSLRTHIDLIYKKLDVTCEADAVVKINELGIFEEG